MDGIVAFILVVAAAWSFFVAFKPRVGFFLEEGWKFRDAEPSDLYLGVTRIGSFVGGVAALVMAGVFAFGGSGDPDPEPSASESRASTVERFQRDLQWKEDECERVKPFFEDVATWNDYRLANPEEVRAVAEANSLELVIKPGPDNDIVTVAVPIPGVEGETVTVVQLFGGMVNCSI
ncbi:DUF6199 family natural product biosynthesis protein [Nocardioides sp. NPDC047086]|uniref:DUF6199 family natural product biosynthesis protein n=1 Tax=Nocardioides sp. NPDC047086 TaxID=3154810 RepID=UPI0033FF9FEC